MEIIRGLEEKFGIALREHQAGHCEQAVALYEEILRENPRHAGAWHLLGVAFQQRGDFEAAVRDITKALSLDDSKAIYHNNLGVSLRALGRREKAADAYRRALAINPNYADALSNLAVVLHESGEDEVPLELLRKALLLAPGHRDATFNLANLYQDLGRLSEAIATYRKAIAIEPNRASAFNNLGNAFLAARDAKQAVASYQEAISRAPDYVEAHLNLAAAYAQQDRVEEAASCFREASRLRPEKRLWPMRAAALCPIVFPNVEEQDRYRAKLERQLDACREVPLDVRWEDLAVDGFIPSFNLKHHGHNNRRLKEKFAALFEPLFPHRRPKLRRGRKPRIGFLVTQQHEGGLLRTMAGIVEQLDPQRFVPVVLCSRSAFDACRGGIRRADVEWVAFPNHLGQAAERIRAADCDVLYHRQIGTDPLNYFLPFVRAAPVQCTAWGSHATTGISAVDYFLSSRLTEPEDAPTHYSERLHCFQTLPGYQRRIPVPPPTRPSDFGLPECRHLYLCPGHIAKFLPHQDPLFRAVLESDPQGLLVLVKDRYEYGAALLKARLERTLRGLMDRVAFVPWQTPEGFARLLSVGQVMLDTWHYSASFMAYDAFSLGLPVVTLPDGFHAGRVTSGLYRKMGLEHLVSETPDAYVASAVRLGTDADYCQSVRLLIGQRSELLFEDRDVVAEHERFFEEALGRAKDAE